MDEEEDRHQKIIIPDITIALNNNPLMQELYKLCTTMMNAIRDSYMLRETISLKETFARAQEIISVFGFAKGMPVQKAKTNGQILFDVLMNQVAQLVEQLVVEVLNCDLSAEQFFEIVDVKSKMFKSCVFMLNIVFLRLGRYIHEYSLSSITVTAYQIYRDYFIEREIESNKSMMQRLVQPLIQSRRNYEIPQIKLKNFLNDISFLDSNNIQLERTDTGEIRIVNNQNSNSAYFRQHFEDTYILQVCQFYTKEQERLSTLPTLEYIDKIEHIYQFEEHFCEALHPTIFPRLKDEMNYIFVANYYPIMWASADVFKPLFNHENFDQIKKAHDFARLDPDLSVSISFMPLDEDDWEPPQQNIIAQKRRKLDRPKTDTIILNQLRSYTEVQGEQLSNFEHLTKDPKTREQIPFLYVESLLKLRDKIDHIIEVYLAGNPAAQFYKEGGFKRFLMEFPDAIKYMSVYLDRSLRQKEQNEIQFNTNIQNICQLAEYVDDKDKFLIEVQKWLQQRLLYGDTQIENEKFFIRELVKKFTQDSTLRKCDGMIQDVLKQHEYTKYYENPEPSVVFSTKIITFDQWPLFIPEKQIQYTQHPLLVKLLQSYEDYFTKFISQERVILWVPTEGRCEVYYQPPCQKEKKVLLLTPAQMIAFMSYDQQDSYTVQELLNRLQITTMSLENLLIPLVAFKVLSREKSDLDPFGADEIISINQKFSNKFKRISLLPHKRFEPKRVESLEDRLEKEAQEVERSHQIDGKIIKLMKTHKQIDHKTLVSEVQRHITLFKATSTKIKTCIDNLMTKEYIKRDLERIDVYEYIS